MEEEERSWPESEGVHCEGWVRRVEEDLSVERVVRKRRRVVALL